MSLIVCPCGFRSDGTPKQAMQAYRTHECELHPVPEQSRDMAWPSVVAFLALCALVSFLCTHGWGLIR
jgi:hypothetical protein